MTLPALQKRHEQEIADLIRAALRARGGNVLKSAKDLDVRRTTLIGLIKHHKLDNETSGVHGRPKAKG